MFLLLLSVQSKLGDQTASATTLWTQLIFPPSTAASNLGLYLCCISKHLCVEYLASFVQLRAIDLLNTPPSLVLPGAAKQQNRIMPVQTRSQKQKAPCSPADAQAIPTKQLRSDPTKPDELNEVLTPRSLKAAAATTTTEAVAQLQDIQYTTYDQTIKLSTASKAPISHPLIEETSAMSLEDADDAFGASFTIPAVQSVQTPASALAALPTTATTTAGPLLEPTVQQPISQTQQPPRRLAPEEKLLKPLPDKPIECTKLPDGPEPVVIEIEYPSTEELQPLESSEFTTDIPSCVAQTLSRMDSTEWVEIISALTVFRRLVVHHTADCLSELPQAMPRVVKALRSLRSALSKTAILTLRDMYLCCAEAMLPLTDLGGAATPMNSALAQLLLKAASNDKKFVIEEAQRALVTMSETLPPLGFFSLLAPYTEHKNPKVRGKTATVVALSFTQFQPMQAFEYGMDNILNIIARLITDNTPEARDSAKKLATKFKKIFDDAAIVALMNIQVPMAPIAGEGAIEEEEPPKQLNNWEYYCQSVLGMSKASSFLKASGL
jgi:CLASP N terminal